MPSSLYKDIKDKTWNYSVKKTILVTLQAYKLHSTLYSVFIGLMSGIPKSVQSGLNEM